MKARLMLGPVLILALIAAIWADDRLDSAPTPSFISSRWPELTTLPPGTLMFIICFVLAIIAARELAVFLRKKGIATSRRVMVFAAGLGMIVSCLVPDSVSGPVAIAIESSAAAFLLVLSLAYFSRKKNTEGVIAGAGGVLLAYVYLGIMFGFLLAIRREHSAWVVLWVLAVTKVCDIGAYFTGKAIGRHKLIPWLSPGKTWEGLIGGVICSAAVAVGGVVLLRSCGISIGLSGASAAGVGAVFGAVGQFGDLLESLMKRDAGEKDSGKGVPGFGGVLDILDSPIMVAPVAFWVLIWANS